MGLIGTGIIKMPKPPLPFHIPKPQRLAEGKRMTLIGTLPVGGGAVLLADRQETISDYAKWDVDKIKHAELQGQYRFLMAGAGDANTIDMVWEEVIAEWHKALP